MPLALAEFLRWFPAEENRYLNFESFSQKAYQILPQEQFFIMAIFLECKIFDKTKAKWEFYAKSSGLLARYLRPIMLHVEFVFINHKSNLLQLIDVLKGHYLDKKNPGSLKITSNTDLIKEKSMIPYLINTDNPDYFDPYCLEF